jgi:ketosteroid isomerase-like protein
MAMSAAQSLRDYLAAQGSGDIDDVLKHLTDDVVFDVGRGRYEGTEVRGFLERLRAVRSQSRLLEVRDVDGVRAVAVFEQRDDDLAPLGIDTIQLDVEVEVAADGRIRRFTARPTPESIAALAAARDAGRSSEGVRLAERAGTLPPAPPS